MRRIALPALLLAVLFACLPALARAGTFTWNNAAGGNWNVTTNWTPNGTPASTDTVVINLAGTYTVTLNVNPTLAQLRVGGGASGTQTLTGSARILTVNGPVTIASNGVLDLTSSTVNGTGALTNAGTLKMVNGTLSQPVTNSGLYAVSGSATQSGALTLNAAGTLRLTGGVGAANALLTSPTGFTNNGTIELTNAAVGYFAQLAITTGTLVNSPGATILLSNGLGGGSRDLLCAVNNQGTITANGPASFVKANAVHANSGLIDLAGGDLTITQSGTGTFTNTNTITVGASRTLTLNGASTTRFNLNSGSMSGAGSVVLNAEVLVLNQDITTFNTKLSSTTSCQITGPDTLHVAAGTTVSLVNVTLTAPTVVENTAVFDLNSPALNGYVHNLGSIYLRASGTANASFVYANEPSALMRIIGGTGSANALLTATNGFTNNGTLEFTNVAAGYFAQLAITSGTLVNSTGATILLSNGLGGGSRDLLCAVSNQGTITVNGPSSIVKANAVHTNTGLIDLAGGNLTITQSGTGTFTNTNTISVGASRTLTLNGASTTRFNLNSGSLAGAGSVLLNAEVLVLNQDITTFNTKLTSTTSCQITGPDTLHVAAGTNISLVNVTLTAPTVVENTAIFDLNSPALNGYVHSLGSIYLRASGTANASFVYASEPSALMRIIGGTGSANALLTATSGFTNNGTLEFTNVAPGYFAQLGITSGTLVNSPNATILFTAGSGGGSRDLLCAVNNQGTMTVNAPASIVKASAVHANSGLIDLAGGNLTITQSGTGTFTNTNTIAVGASRTLTLNGASTTRFNLNSGSLAGAGTVLLNAEVLVLNQDITTFNAKLSSTTSCQITGPDTLHVAAGTNISLVNVTLTAPTVVENTAIFDLNSPALNGYVHNLGSIYVRASSTANASFVYANEPSALMRIIGGTGSANALLTATSGFTNNGTLELTNVAPGYFAQLGITTGTLVNSPGATILFTAGSGGASRDLLCAVNNQGTVTVNAPASIVKANAVHANSGTIDLAGGDLTITQSGTGTFTNTNTISVGASRTLTLNGASTTRFNLNSGSLAGAGSVLLNAEVLVLNQDITTFNAKLTSTTSCQIIGPDTLHVAAGTNISLVNVTLTAPTVVENTAIFDLNSPALNGYVHNLGSLYVRASSTANASFVYANEPSALMRIIGGTGSANALLTATSGFTNNGTLEFTNVAPGYFAQLGITTGTLVNSPGATILFTAGSGGASRDLLCAVNNQGTITVNAPASIVKANATHANTGLINLAGGNLTITQSGTGAFTNTNTITVGASRTLTLNGASTTRFNLNSGSMGGAGSVLLNAEVLVLNQDVTTFNTKVTSTTSCQIIGPDTLHVAAGTNISLVNVTLTAPTVVENTAIFDLNSPALNGYVHSLGSLYIRGSSTANASFVYANEPSALMRIIGGTGSANALLTATNGFTNNGTIELTNVAPGYFAQLGITTGALVNSSTGQIHTINASGGGSRDLLCPVTNFGNVLIDGPSTFAKASAVHVNFGTITLGTNNLTITQSGTTPQFANRGTLSCGPGRTFTNTGGTFLNGQLGVLTGSGTFSSSTAWTDSGTVRAGNPTGILAFVGTRNPVSTWRIVGSLGSGVDPVLGQGQYSAAVTTTLIGTLQVQILPGVVPAAGHEFWLMKYPAKTGNFSAILLPTDGLGRGFLAYVRDTGVVVIPYDQTWSKLFPDGPYPAAREGHSAVLDTLGEKLIVFGGLSDSGPLGDTYVLSHATSNATGYPAWTKLTPGGSTPPVRRYDHAAGYDRLSNRMVILGGTDSSGTALGDYQVLTFANGTGGSPQWITYALPPSVGTLTGAAAAFDETGDNLIVFGGATSSACASVQNAVYVVSNADGVSGVPTWTLLSPSGPAPSPRTGASVSYDPVRNTLSVFGGEDCSGAVSDVAWVLSNANGVGTPVWTALSPAGSAPPLLKQTRAALDPQNGWLDIFGGSVTSVPTDTCWTLTDASSAIAPSWYPRSQYGTRPPARAHHTLAMGSRDHVSVMFAGLGVSGRLNDVWRRETDFGRVLAVDGGDGPKPPPAARIVRTGFSRPPAPNPSRGTTTFAIAVAHEQDLTVDVFDIGGRQVASLHHGLLAAGEHTLRWDGRGTSGAAVHAGLYLVRLHGTNVNETRRIVLTP